MTPMHGPNSTPTPRPGQTQGPGALSRTERLMLTAVLRGDSPDMDILRTQLAKATAVSRTHSGVGFMTRLQIPDDVPAAADTVTRELRPVRASHPALGEPAEFLLQVRGGRLAVLEAFCFDGAWPADEAGFQVLA
jgi:hypothetical protein